MGIEPVPQGHLVSPPTEDPLPMTTLGVEPLDGGYLFIVSQRLVLPS
jgi:hypothetical protein